MMVPPTADHLKNPELCVGHDEALATQKSNDALGELVRESEKLGLY